MNCGQSRDAGVITCSLFLVLLIHVNHVGCAIKPAILSEPEDITVASSSFTILCIKFPQNATVTWYHNGRRIIVKQKQHLEVSGDGSLHVKKAFEQRDEGSYHCLVSIRETAVISRTATVQFAYLKPFGTGDWIIDKQYGDFAVIKCMAPESSPHRTIQWTKKTSDSEIPLLYSSHYAVSQDGDLHFAYLTEANSGEYICTVRNLFIMKHVVRTVTINVMPANSQLRSQPPKVADTFRIPKTVLKGDRFVLECIVYGMSVTRITLRKKGYRTLLGTTTGNINRLVIDSFTEHDAGKYRCRASGPAGLSDTKTTLIKMEARPEWIKAPQDTTAGVNTTIILPCVAYGIPAVKYIWYFNGRPLISTQRHNFTEGNLTIYALVHQDSGMYQCFVSNKHGQFHSNMELTVSEIPAGFGPGSQSPKSNQTALVYTNVVMHCNPNGAPKPLVRWQFASGYLTNSLKYTIMKNGNLRITNVTNADTGKYTCDVSNRLGRDTRSGYLTIVDYVVTDVPSSKVVVLGQDIEFTCGVTTVKGIEITFRWLKYMYLPLRPNQRIRSWRTEAMDPGSHTSNQKGHLKISGATYADAGLYSCKAEGNKKIITANAFLTVQGPPDPPTNVDIHQPTSRGEVVNVTWLSGKPNHSKITKIIIQSTTQYAPKTWQTIAEESEPAKGWTQVALSPWVKYTFRAIAVNSIGNSTPSSHSTTIRAPPAAPTKYPENVTWEGTSPFTLKISWQPLALIDHNGPRLYYVVYHERTDGQGKQHRNEVRNSSHFLITGAEYYVKYTIKLQAANAVGFGPESPAVYGFSGEKLAISTVPVGVPRDLDVTISSATLAYATWTSISTTRESTRGKLLGYKVYYWTAPSGQTPQDAEFKATIDTSTTLYLQPYTSYRFQVVAYNSAGDGPGSNVVGPLTTPETKNIGTTVNPTGLCTEAPRQDYDLCSQVPEAPEALALSIQNQSYIELRWSPPQKANGIIVDYVVTIQKFPEQNKPTTGRTMDSSTELGIHNLNTKATYKISVLAVNRVGPGPPVAAMFDLPAAPKSSPKNLTAIFDEYNEEATLTWESSDPDIEGFRIYYWSPKKGEKTIDLDKAQKKETLTGIEKGTLYYFEIAAFKTVYGGHYILGPRSKRATVGEVPKIARKKTKSSGSFPEIPWVLIFTMLLVWLDVHR